MRRLLPILLVVVVVAAGCSGGGDEPADLTAICPTLGQVPDDLDPFASLSTGSPEDVRGSVDEVRSLYEALVDDMPSDQPYPGEVLSSTTIPTTSVVPDPAAEGGGDGEAAESDAQPATSPDDVPTPKEDLEQVLDVLDDVRDVLADHDFDVTAADEDLRQLDAFATPEPILGWRAATHRLRLLIDRLCPATAPTTAAEGAGEAPAQGAG